MIVNSCFKEQVNLSVGVWKKPDMVRGKQRWKSLESDCMDFVSGCMDGAWMGLGLETELPLNS